MLYTVSVRYLQSYTVYSIVCLHDVRLTKKVGLSHDKLTSLHSDSKDLSKYTNRIFLLLFRNVFYFFALYDDSCEKVVRHSTLQSPDKQKVL